MRPLVHPAAENMTVEGILHALADPVRMALMVEVTGQTCSQSCSGVVETVAERAVPKSTLSEHFRVLREAGLVRGERRGVEMHHVSRCDEVEARFPGLLTAIVAAYGVQRERKKRNEAR